MKRYFKYFWWLFLILGIVAAVYIGLLVMHSCLDKGYVRNNTEAPAQRVYDYADKLTDEEEDSLEDLIAKRENEIGCDLVLVIIDEPILTYCGYTDPADNTQSNWEECMMNYADDFYDQNQFGYNAVHGDGALLLDNWYKVGTAESQGGSWLSTCGRVYDHYSYAMINRVLDDIYDLVDVSPYRAYKSYVENVYREMSGNGGDKLSIPWYIILLLSVIATGTFISIHLKNLEGKKTTASTTYVEQNSVVYHEKKDELVNSFVTSHVISSDSSGGGHSSGRAGGHRSGGGVSHGGGGRRR